MFSFSSHFWINRVQLPPVTRMVIQWHTLRLTGIVARRIIGLMVSNPPRGAIPPYLTSARAAKILGTNKRTLHNWIQKQRIPAPEIDPKNGYYLWTLADIDAARIVLAEEAMEK